jgi:plastocyanin
MNKPHFTTRRGFVASLGFGGVSLYGLWVAYGAAPGPLALFKPHAAEAAAAGAHGGGHAAAENTNVVDEFRRLHAEFIDRFAQADGAVQPGVLAAAVPDMTHMPASTGAVEPAAHDMSMMEAAPVAPEASAGGHAGGHGGAAAEPAEEMAAMDAGAAHAVADETAPDTAHDAHADTAEGAPIEVYLLAERWYFEPAHLRLESGVAYRFRMLAADIPHGASIALGGGSRMARLRPGAVTEMELRFDRPGEHLVYCSLYCGQGHDLMQARIEVV